jgi:hypothetical protein
MSPEQHNWSPIDHGAIRESDGAFPFATDTEGNTVLWSPEISSHIHLIGPPGSGKTATKQVLTYNALTQGWTVYIIATALEKTNYTFAKGYAQEVATDQHHALEVLQQVVKIMERRQHLMTEHQVQRCNDLREASDRHQVLLVIDEVTALYDSDIGNQATQLSQRIAAEGRACSIFMACSSQRCSSGTRRQHPVSMKDRGSAHIDFWNCDRNTPGQGIWQDVRGEHATEIHVWHQPDQHQTLANHLCEK